MSFGGEGSAGANANQAYTNAGQQFNNIGQQGNQQYSFYDNILQNALPQYANAAGTAGGGTGSAFALNPYQQTMLNQGQDAVNRQKQQQTSANNAAFGASGIYDPSASQALNNQTALNYSGQDQALSAEAHQNAYNQTMQNLQYLLGFGQQGLTTGLNTEGQAAQGGLNVGNAWQNMGAQNMANQNSFWNSLLQLGGAVGGAAAGGAFSGGGSTPDLSASTGVNNGYGQYGPAF